jgi:farnesyl-diphosphate farnesyltransferase
MTQQLTTASSEPTPIDDWSFCVQSLGEVSRTFTQPIMLLPEEQRRALTVGYLLCRVADTIEDCQGIEVDEKDGLFSLFHRIIKGNASSKELFPKMAHVEASDAEIRLIENLPRVMAVFETQSHNTKVATVRWVSEMADGMRLYTRRAEGREFFSLISLVDLERYCYFVAGTVGHLVTDLFDEAIGDTAVAHRLRNYAESFGLGLQMVNIVKDVTDDFQRGVSFLPRQLCVAEGFEPEEMLLPANRAAAKRVARRVIECAQGHLDSAFNYMLTIPPRHHQLRLFCLLPLWMALETLALAVDSDAMFEPTLSVKISRETVARVIADCGRDCQNDDALRAAYAHLVNQCH